ncbi:hypothetical protein [Hufsiella ginkgonis]|uniref:Pectate lyase superfamily protein domain-containing protein n=1 Tax=Hufsiella ginkgonis TaxID=2695274 RepID=A0A7K1XSG8_9SPHI|nr:hypothetical protein [Hufsiella ginkgonis]MXV13892.1 hypothetical protein [Hufsiella ginkgonis]
MSKSWQSCRVRKNANDALEYFPDNYGNIIPDFGDVGCHYDGNRTIPLFPVVMVLTALAGDNTLLIQDAIDELSLRDPNADGTRGAILLTRGTYSIAGEIQITANGIVLRGEGCGTRLVATGSPKSLIAICGSGSREQYSGSYKNVVDEFVPIGSLVVCLDNTTGLIEGDQVLLTVQATDSWLTAIGMNQIPARMGTKQWTPENYRLDFERSVVAIRGNAVELNYPIVMEIDQRFGGVTLVKCTFNNRVNFSGIESLQLEAVTEPLLANISPCVAISIDKAEYCWITSITALNFSGSAVKADHLAKNITVRDAVCINAETTSDTGRRYSFQNNGQLNLFMNLVALRGRHDYVTGAKTLGPNVFFNCTSILANSDIGPHERWSAGTLYDNVTTDYKINVQNRGNWGTGQGWTGVTQVLWNCKGLSASVESPPVSGKNYAIGFFGQRSFGRNFQEKLIGDYNALPHGEWEGLNVPGLDPWSLYLAQSVPGGNQPAPPGKKNAYAVVSRIMINLATTAASDMDLINTIAVYLVAIACKAYIEGGQVFGPGNSLLNAYLAGGHPADAPMDDYGMGEIITEVWHESYTNHHAGWKAWQQLCSQEINDSDNGGLTLIRLIGVIFDSLEISAQNAQIINSGIYTDLLARVMNDGVIDQGQS